MFLTILATVLLCCLSFVYFFICHPLKYWKIRGVPYVEPEFFYGNSRGLGTTIHALTFYQELYKKLKGKGPVGGMYLFIQPKILILDLDLVQQILVKDFKFFTNRGMYFNEVDDPLSAGLINIEDGAWKKRRNKVSPVFTSGKLKLMFELVAQTADKLVEIIRTKSVSEDSIKVKSLHICYTVDNTATAAFGVQSNAIEEGDSDMLKIITKAQKPTNFIVRNVTQKYRKLARILKYREYTQEETDMLISIFHEMVQSRKENPELRRNDFMDTMVKLHDPSLADPLTFHQVAALATEVLAAGYEGTSSSLTFCLSELSQNLEIQAKARESVVQALEKQNGIFNYESLKEMTYLDQCIDETLRKHPIAAALARIASSDYRIPNSDIVIEKGIKIIVPIHAIHHDPKYFPEPSKFDPDRFSPEETAKRHSFAFIPFGGGPRVCIGNRFAKLQVKIALVKILKAFEFEVDSLKNVVEDASPEGLTLNASKNCQIRFREILK